MKLKKKKEIKFFQRKKCHISCSQSGSFVNDIFKKEGFMLYKNYQVDSFYQRFIYNRNFLKRNKLYFPNYRRYQDPPFLIKTMNKAKRFYAIKNITNIYRSNSTKKFNLIQVIDIFSGLNESLELVKKMKLYKLYWKIINRLKYRPYAKIVKQFQNNDKVKNIIHKIEHNNKIILYNNF